MIWPVRGSPHFTVDNQTYSTSGGLINGGFFFLEPDFKR
jgi:hypothetical protein